MVVHFYTSMLFAIGLLSQNPPNSLNSFVPECCVGSPRAIDRARACLSVFSQCFARAGSQSVVLLSPPSLLLFQLPPFLSLPSSLPFLFPCLLRTISTVVSWVVTQRKKGGFLVCRKMNDEQVVVSCVSVGSWNHQLVSPPDDCTSHSLGCLH